MTTIAGHVGLQKLSVCFEVRNLVVGVGIVAVNFVAHHEITWAMIATSDRLSTESFMTLDLNMTRAPKET